MSLHLIESRKSLTATPRKRGGTMASVLLHAALVAGAFTVATAAPVPSEATAPDDIIYVAEPKTETQAPDSPATRAPDISQATPARQPVLPVLSEPLTISIDMPKVSIDLVVDPSVRDFHSRRTDGTTASSDKGTGIGLPSGSAPTGIMNELEVDRPVAILSGYRTPRYPEALRAAGVEEILNARFVVDTLGRIEVGSLEMPGAEHAAFAAAIREALANARYRPAEVGGRRVRQQVSQAFVFSLRRN